MRISTACLAVTFTLVAACATATPPPPGEGVTSDAQICQLECACTGCSADEVADCESGLVDLTAKAGDTECQEELESFLSCVTDTAECVEGELDVYCDSREDELVKCIAGWHACSHVNNGICDEPEGTGYCPEGSDVVDCTKSCAYTHNGVCDEPSGSGLCAEGTDLVDCDDPPCPYTNDGTCDEPEGTGDCPQGTDFADCATSSACDYTNDGTCDEPEGTGDCPEGSDVADCATSSACNYTNDGECDEPEGTGLCAEGSDVADCAVASCSSCYDYAFGDPALEPCPTAAALYDAVVDCICIDSCSVECADSCQGGAFDAACDSCLQTSCSAQITACENDI